MADKKRRSHEENRKLVCAACGDKCLKEFGVTETIEECIKEKVYDRYDRNNSTHPNGICGTCRKNLFLGKKKAPVPARILGLWSSLNYEMFCRPPTHKDPCDCQICQVARFKKADLHLKAAPDLPRVVKTFKDGEEAAAAEVGTPAEVEA